MNIAVIGDFMIDHYLWGKSNRISPEAPVPVVEVIKEEDRLGGAGNVVNNLLSLGANVIISTVLGNESERMLKLLQNVDTDGIFIDNDKKNYCYNIYSVHDRLFNPQRCFSQN